VVGWEAIGTQIFEPLPVSVEALPKLLLDAKNLLSFGCGLGSREEFGQEKPFQVIPAHHGPECKVVHPIFCIAH